MPNSSNTPSDDGASAALTPDDFDTLDDILDELRTRNSETPQWEFCEGFMAALICGRRIVTPDEYLPVLLDTGEDGEGKFADDAQFELFFKLWSRRWKEITASLDADVESLEDDRAFYPQVMDVRGVMASLSEEERATAMRDNPGEDIPAFGQVWALGFMFAVEAWPDDWVAPPKDKDAIKWLNDALGALVALTEDDTGPVEVSVLEQEDGKEGPPSMSKARLEAFGEAVWAVYDLREMWQSIGPRVEQVFKTAEPGRNDLCHCGSGRKYKKCHGMN
ncbi:MAG: hypothetical protein RJB10_1436 [Pseudomonadota bacterium]|jgi:uncharacterized protein